jgi:pseudaminic acid cytidylyltransferase
MKKEYICLIPARGGSKRIKNKNIRKFLGKSFLERVIENAKKSKIFKKIYVSTDSIKIKNEAIKFGAEVPYLRSKELSNDYAIIKQVIDDFIDKMNSSFEDKQINLFVIYPTSIFVDIKLIHECKKLLENSEYVTTLKKFPHPIQRALRYKDYRLVPLNLKKKLMRTQDLEEHFYNTGQIDCIKVNAWKEKKMFHKLKAKFIIMDALASIDIDTPEDLKLAYKIFNFKNNNKF